MGRLKIDLSIIQPPLCAALYLYILPFPTLLPIQVYPLDSPTLPTLSPMCTSLLFISSSHSPTLSPISPPLPDSCPQLAPSRPFSLTRSAPSCPFPPISTSPPSSTLPLRSPPFVPNPSCHFSMIKSLTNKKLIKNFKEMVIYFQLTYHYLKSSMINFLTIHLAAFIKMLPRTCSVHINFK